MHELGLLSAMVKTIEGIAQEERLVPVGRRIGLVSKERLERVEKIVLQVGELSGVVPAYLESCYPAAVYKTFMEDTELELEIIPGIARCERCGRQFNAVAEDLKCPDCGGEELTACGGTELMIKEIVGC